MLSRFTNKDNHSKKQEFKNILARAKAILEQTEEYGATHPIYQLIKAIINYEFDKSIFTAITSNTDRENGVRKYHIGDLVPHLTEYEINKNFNEVVAENLNIHLGRDSILTGTWGSDKLVSAIATTAETEKWTQKSHYIDLFLPYGVSFVTEDGIHTITKGILKAEGQLKPARIFNISDVHKDIYTDGVAFYKKCDGSIFSPVENFNLSVVFGIGALIVENAKTREIRFHGKSIFRL